MSNNTIKHVRVLADLFNHLESKRKWKDYFFGIQDHFEKPVTFGLMESNMIKNRYCNVWPYDETRVKLIGKDDYINASYVQCPVVDQQFVCTQEPIHNGYGSQSTKSDFWKMIWQQGCSVIVMLNEPSENNNLVNPEFYPYWPTGECSEGGVHKYERYVDEDISVRLLKKDNFDFYVISELELSIGDNEVRKVFHLNFIGWHDYSIPTSPAQFVEFLELARTYYEQSGPPPVVHCSAGVGRTGSFVLVDTVLRILKEEPSKEVDIKEILEQLRKQRMWFVQTTDQLRFCFQAILHGAEKF